MTLSTGRKALLSAFDRLFERAASKLNLECTAQEKDEARRYFVERCDAALRLVDQADVAGISEPTMVQMEAAIDGLSPTFIAAHLATVPLALHVQEVMRQIALRAAERRVLEHLATQVDETYGGN